MENKEKETKKKVVKAKKTESKNKTQSPKKVEKKPTVKKVEEIKENKEEKENKKKYLILLLILLFIVIFGISVTFGKDILDAISDQVIEVLDLHKPTTPTITGGSDEWAKERLVKIEKDSEAKAGLAYYEYCVSKEKSTKKCEWKKTETKNVKVTDTGIYYVTFRAVDKEERRSYNSNSELIYIDNENPVIKNIKKETRTNSIKVEIEAKDEHSGLEKYYYSLDGKNYKEGKTSYTYSGLEANKEYTIYIKVEDKVGNKIELSMQVKTSKIEETVPETPGEGNDDTTGDNNGNIGDNNEKPGDDNENQQDKCEINCDLDGDGKCDLNCDTDKDGKCDLNCDTDKDGKCDLNCDTDKDGKCDLNCDTDNDGKCDLNCDTNENGKCDLNCDTDQDGKCDVNCDTDNDGKCDGNCSKDEDDLIIPEINLNKVPAEFLYGEKYDLPSYYKFGPIGGEVECLVDGKEETDTENLGIGKHIIICTARGNNGINVRVSKQVEVKVPVGVDETFNGWIKLNLYYPANSTNWQWRIGKEGEIRTGYDNTGWQAYTGPILVKIEDVDDVYIRYELNGEIYVVAPNGKVAVDIEPEKYTLMKEDKVARLSTNTLTKTKVEIHYDKNAITKEYRIGNGRWQEYTESFEVGANTLIEARAVKEEKIYDSEGNYLYTKKVTGTDSVFISEYVKNDGGSTGGSSGTGGGSVSGTVEGGYTGTITYGTATQPNGVVITTPVTGSKPSMYLVGPEIIGNPKTQLVESVKIEVRPQEEAEKIYVSVGGNNYQEYTESFEVRNNTIIKAYYVRKSDGKVSNVSYYYVQNIKVGNKPYVRIDIIPGNYLSETQKSVEVKISGSNYDALEYSLDGIMYKPYTTSFEVLESTTVYARGKNKYGTTIERLTIPTVKPSTPKEELTVEIYTKPTECKGLINKTEVSIVYDSRALKKYYRLASDAEYKEYTGPFEIRENTTVYAYAIGENSEGSSKKGIDFLTTGIMEPIIEVTPTEAANMVKVTIHFDKNANKKYYQINNGERLYYTGPFEMYENAEIYAYNSNELGYEADGSYEINSITKLPNYLVIEKDKYFIIRLNYPEGSLKEAREYKWKENGTWKVYDPQGILLIKPEYKDEFDFESYDGIKVEDENGREVIFTDHYYLVDVAFSQISENLFMRWDTTKIKGPEIFVSPEEVTTEVEVGIMYSSSLVERYYKILSEDGSDTGWLEYTGAFKVSENNVVVYAKGKTFSKEDSEVSRLRITNIDLEAPEIIVKGDFTTPKQQVTVTVQAIDNMMTSAVIWAKGEKTLEYFEKEGTSIPNNGTFTVEENGKYTIYAIDEVGNEAVEVIEVTNIDKNAPDIIIKVLTERLAPEIEVSIDYGDSKTKEYKIGEEGTYQTYTENLIISSYDVYKLANSDGSLTIYAKGKDEAENEEIVSEKVYVLDLDMPESPKIILSDGYPILTKDGMVLGKASYVVYDTSRDDLINYYRIDEGEWTLYTGPITIVEGKIEAKSVKEKSGLTLISEGEVVVPNDSVIAETYDNDLETKEIIAVNTTKKFTLSSNVMGRKVRFYIGTTPASNATIKVYDKENNVLESIKVISPVTVLEIPDDGYIVGVSAGSSKLELKEITIREENIFIDKGISPVITVDNPEWTTEKVVNIKYPEEEYRKEYSIDNGETWVEYTSPFIVDKPLTVIARLVKEDKVLSASTFIITKIDTETPIVELNMSGKIQLGYDLELPTYYKLGTSGGSVECKTDGKVVTNINELKIGTHEIKCVAKSKAGKEASITKTVKIIETSEYKGDSILAILKRDDIITGKYNLEVNDEIYPVHVYVFDEDQHFTTNQTFGDDNDVSDGTNYAQNMVIVKVNGDVTIDEGVTVGPYYTQYGGPKGFTLYVTGALTNNGTIDNSHGAYAEGQNVYLWKNADGTYEYVPSVGGAGGESAKQSNGGSGEAGITVSERATGGGGAGGGYNAVGGSGGAGTSYSGGTGGGASGLSGVGAAGNTYGGAGGNGTSGSEGGGGGAGNPGGAGPVKGSTGTGGLIVIYANEYNNNGTITAKGSNGGRSKFGDGTWFGGGSSGGGTINIFYINENLTKGNTTVNGGSSMARNYRGGAGGSGTVTYTKIPLVAISSNYIYPHLTLTEFSNDYYLISIPKLSSVTNPKYSLDNGNTWLDYSEPFKVEPGVTVLAKGKKSDGTETDVVTYQVLTPTDNLLEEAYDNNTDTSATITANTNQTFTLSSDVVGKSLRFFLSSTPSSDASIKIYNNLNEEILNTTFIESLTVINIPENSYKVVINAGSSDLSINEINIRKININETNDNPVIEIGTTEWTASKIVVITYPEDEYVKEYSLDLGQTWLEYLSQITVEKATTVLTRTMKNGKVISSSSFLVTTIDETEPTITLEIPEEIIYKTEYSLPTSYTVDETKSGGSAICKIGEEIVTSTKDLAIGPYEITCTVTTGAGKEASITKTLNVIDEATDITLEALPEKILVGSSYNLPTSVTGSTYSCKIGDTVYTNTKDLAVGTYEITCSVTSIGGNTKEITKQLEVYEETLEETPSEEESSTNTEENKVTEGEIDE